MNTLDRYLLRSLLINYAIALAVMMSLYMVLDLFVNIVEFTEDDASFWTAVGGIASYYGAHSFLYFSQLSGVITLFACMITVARMRRANELTAILSSGVSLHRVAVPVIAFGLCASLLWYADTELAIPRVAHLLARSHDDATGANSRGVWFVNDGPARLVSALRFLPAERRMEDLLVIQRDERGAFEKVIEAEEAVWEDLPGHEAGGVWRLIGGEERMRARSAAAMGPRDTVHSTKVELYESRLNPTRLEARQGEQWLDFASSSQLADFARNEPMLTNQIRRIKHGRFSAPLVHILLLLLGLPFFLSREPANMFNDAGKCLMVCGACYLMAYTGDNLVRTTTLSALPAWLPLIVFAPVAVVMIDRVRT